MNEPSIEALVAADIAARARKGQKKYGLSVAENPLPLQDWLQHAYEESLDLPIYLKRAIVELESQNAKLKSGEVDISSRPDYAVPCECIRCLRERKEHLRGIPIERTRMIVCPTCGNKRCPHASDHAFKCTGSNDLDQSGSIFQTK